MKYKGKELIEMTPEKWDGKSREMLVWNDYDTKFTLALVCGFTIKGHPIADTGNYKKENWYKHFNVFQYCAEIPKDEPAEILEELLETTSFEDALLTRIKELKEEVSDLKKENGKLKNELNAKMTNELREYIEKDMNLVYE